MADIQKIVTDALVDALRDEVAPDVMARLSAGRDVEFATLDLDSLTRFEIIMQIEEQLDIELDDDEVQEQGSVLALVLFLEQRLDES